MDKEERKKVTEKGRKWLSVFLRRLLVEENDISDETKKHIVKTSCDVYREEMENPGFYDMVNEFYSERRSAAEKDRFSEYIMCLLVRSGKVKAEYAKRYLGL